MLVKKESFSNEEQLLHFINNNSDKICWFEKLQNLLFSYMHADLKELGFSQIYKPLFFTLFLKLGDGLEKNAGKQAEKMRDEYRRLFGVELEREENLFVLVFVLYDYKPGVRFPFEQTNLSVRSKWPLSVELKVVPLPINNLKSENVLSKEFRFQKHIYLKNKIQTYSLNETMQMSSLNISDVDRCKKLNLADVDVFRETILKNIFAYFIAFFEKWFNQLLAKNLEVRLSKRKGFWGIFGGETSKPRANPNEITVSERQQFNVAEMYLMIGNYENAGFEFKSLAQSFLVSLKETQLSFLFGLHRIIRVLVAAGEYTHDCVWEGREFRKPHVFVVCERGGGHDKTEPVVSDICNVIANGQTEWGQSSQTIGNRLFGL